MLEQKIYFSKIEFREYVGYQLNSILLLNLVEGTLAYQVYEKEKRIYAPAIAKLVKISEILEVSCL